MKYQSKVSPVTHSNYLRNVILLLVIVGAVGGGVWILTEEPSVLPSEEQAEAPPGSPSEQTAPTSLSALVVNSFEDLGDADLTDNSCSTQVGGSECTLRAAIEEANQPGGPNIIDFDPDLTYPNTITLISELTISDFVTITGPRIGNLTIDAQNNSRHFDIVTLNEPHPTLTSDSTITSVPAATPAPTSISPAILGSTPVPPNQSIAISNLTLANGKQSGYEGSRAGGGSIRFLCPSDESICATSQQTLTLDSMIIRDSESNNLGGALHIHGQNQRIHLNLVNTSLHDNSAQSSGGALRITGASLAISNTHFMNNNAYSSGGAIDCESANSVEINGSHFISNSVRIINNESLNRGGGIAFNKCFWRIIGSQLKQNQAERGGAIYSLSSQGRVDSSKLLQNKAVFASGESFSGEGGAIYNQVLFGTVGRQDSSILLAATAQSPLSNATQSILNQSVAGSSGSFSLNSTLDIYKSNLISNTASNRGGAIVNSGDLVVEQSELYFNQTLITPTGSVEEPSIPINGGGAIHTTGSLKIATSTFYSNTSTGFGGAILNEIVDHPVYISNSTISKNRANLNGGALYNHNAPGFFSSSIVITSTTISANSADEGGGIYLISTSPGSDEFPVEFRIANSLVAGNEGSFDQVSDCAAEVSSGNPQSIFSSLGYNLTGENTSTGCDFNGLGDKTVQADQIFDLVLARRVSDHGGPTETQALLPNSQAINQIPSGINGCGTTIATDQRGVDRPIDTKCDVGAYESLNAQIQVTKTVGIEADSCATTSSTTVRAGTQVYYCLTVRNSGSFTLPTVIVNDPSRAINGFLISEPLAIGEVRQLTHTVIPQLGPVIANEPMTNTVTVTSKDFYFYPDPIIDESTAVVDVVPVYTVTLIGPQDLKIIGDPEPQTVTATVIDHRGLPAVGKVVRVDVTGVHTSGGLLETDSLGQVTYDVLGANNGDSLSNTGPFVSDTVNAWLDHNNNAQIDGDESAAEPVTIDWRRIKLDVRGIAEGTEAEMNRTMTASVKTIDNDALVEVGEYIVYFRITGPNAIPDTSVPVRGGEAAFTYISRPAQSHHPPHRPNQSGWPAIRLIGHDIAPQEQTNCTAGVDRILVWVELSGDRTFDMNSEPFEEFELCSAITLAYFTAQANVDKSVTLTWETGVEIDNAGFNLYRSEAGDGVFTKINRHLIGAKGMGAGSQYSYIDIPPKAGAYFYLLEDIDYNGLQTRHGPVEVVLEAR